MQTQYCKTTTLLLTVMALLLAINIDAQPQREFRPPENIRLTADIPYAATDNPRQMLDLLLPREPGQEPLPVIVFIHGGAWRGGSKEGGRSNVARAVASGNYAGVSINYRLSGESKWPTQIHDCQAAIRWIKSNAEKYNLNPDRIGIWGSSAGGHLVAMLGTSAGVTALDGRLGRTPDLSCAVTCVVDFFGPTDFTTMDRDAIEGSVMQHSAPDSPESLLMGYQVTTNPEGVATASPITYISKDDPPFLIVHGTRDPVVPYAQSVTFHKALQTAGVSSTLLTVSDGGHGQGFGAEVNQSVMRFFDHHLRGIPSEWADRSVRAEQRSRSPN